MYQHVLVPTDGSDGTRRAITHALTIANRFDATVHALSVVPEGPLGALEDRADVTAGARRAVERVEREATRDGIPVRTATKTGVPHEVILEYAEDEGIDMLVLGTQGRTGLDRVLVGSVAERIVRLADVPVVTVRLTDEIEIEDAAEAERIARERAAEEGYSQLSLRETPYRTSGTWTVTLESDGELVDVDVDAVAGTARIVETE
ncbi:universal stress protein [Natronococcus occultus]|uniref:Universal stress protein UspA-like protein n=1 Tax=Natronococcus occultus SP4 TaxID=694430 RepID=L0JW48_9EURY|nr:universal stress protein [Natronococcus occultus]AGB37252.1 universal stress protein UspA-like protein [Natronococcus occultus SP4]